MRNLLVALFILFLNSLVSAEAVRVSWSTWHVEGALTPYPKWVTEKHSEIMPRYTYEELRQGCQACSDWEVHYAPIDDVDAKCEKERERMRSSGEKSKKSLTYMFNNCRDYLMMERDEYTRKYFSKQ